MIVAACAFVAWPATSPAGPSKPALHAAVAAPSETAAQLPIGQVVLFSSGVGYFQREGTIDGDAHVDLSFPTNEVRKSLETPAAYNQYLDKFDQQETQIEKYQADIKKMQETVHQQQKEFEDYLNTFSAE